MGMQRHAKGGMRFAFPPYAGCWGWSLLVSGRRCCLPEAVRAALRWRVESSFTSSICLYSSQGECNLQINWAPFAVLMEVIH